MLASLPLMLDQSFRSTDVRDRVCWPHGGLVWGGEELGPKRVEGRLMEKVNPLMDQAEGLHAGSFPRGAVQNSRWGAEKLFKT